MGITHRQTIAYMFYSLQCSNVACKPCMGLYGYPLSLHDSIVTLFILCC
jgi:hypothetical protein